MHLEIRHLRLIEAIAREGGVTKAATNLHLTQSALSHQLKEIEERLATPLFLRLNKKMILTKAGEQVLESAQKVLHELIKTEESILRLAKGQEGILRISTQCNTCYHWLPSMLTLFHQKYSRVEVQIVVEATHRPIAALLEGKLDLAIAYSKVADKNLSYFPLFQDELLVVMRPDHPLSNRSYIHAQDFADQSLIVYSVPLEENTLFQQVLNPAGVVPKSIYKVMLTEAILEMVKAGIGITILAKWAVAPYLKSGELCGVRLTRKGIHREWWAVMLKNDSAPAYNLEFAKLLAQRSIPAIRTKKGRNKL